MAENSSKDIEMIVQEDSQKKLALREKENRYYPEKMQEFGLKSMERFLKYCPDPSKFMKLGITFAHKDLEAVAEAIADNKPWAVVSGLNPSGPLHLGHKAIFDELLWMQQHGADVYIPITNDESYTVGKTKSLAEARKIAYEQVIPSIIAMGFDSKKTHIFVDSDYPDIYNVAMDLSTKLTLNKAFGVFGFDKKEEGENPGTMFYRAAVQIAQILLPQYDEFGGPKPTIIPVGIDQHPYILLARDIAEKKGFIPPAEIVTKFLWGLDGKGKMSASRPESAVFLNENPEVVAKRLRSAYTGGSPLASFQREHGGIPEICPIQSLRTYHFEPDNRVSTSCSSGEVLCGECKKRGIESTVAYLIDHQSKLEDAKRRIDEFILRTPIRSMLKYD
jgi:tryptophanyl-tRNA synthetase